MTVEILLIVLTGLVLLPVVAYLMVKFATIGFYRGRQRYREMTDKRNKHLHSGR